MSHRLKSFLMGGFECSSHRRFDGRRLDLIESTGHERFAQEDYARLADLGIMTARDGLRWHLIESASGKFDFSSVERQIEAAEEHGVQVIWDLFHYGYPDHIDIFHRDFAKRFASFSAAFAQFHLARTGRAPAVVPINEISFFSWIAGDIGHFFPHYLGKGDEMKYQLVRTCIEAINAIRSIAPESLIVMSEPAVYVTARREEPWNATSAESYRLSQFQALDMVAGKLMPELGGSPNLVDIIGVNYYLHNQWYYPDREMIPLGGPDYRPLRSILREVYERYKKPLIVSETGTEDDARPSWASYIMDESLAAIGYGVDLNGVCLYPIVNHPGWDDDRHCHNGLWDYADESGRRNIHQPLAEVINKFNSKLLRPTPLAFRQHG